MVTLGGEVSCCVCTLCVRYLLADGAGYTDVLELGSAGDRGVAAEVLIPAVDAQEQV